MDRRILHKKKLLFLITAEKNSHSKLKSSFDTENRFLAFNSHNTPLHYPLFKNNCRLSVRCILHNFLRFFLAAPKQYNKHWGQLTNL